MGKFKLTFRLNYDDEFSGNSKADNTFERIIYAESLQAAIELADKMVGEVIYEREWLSELLGVEVCSKEVEPNVFDQQMWQIRLGLAS